MKCLQLELGKSIKVINVSIDDSFTLLNIRKGCDIIANETT